MAGEVEEDHSAPFELKEQGTGFLIPGQHDLPGAQSNTGTLERQQRAKRPKVLNAKVITDIFCCKRLCTTSIENITIETSEDGKQKIVRCTKKHHI